MLKWWQPTTSAPILRGARTSSAPIGSPVYQRVAAVAAAQAVHQEIFGLGEFAADDHQLGIEDIADKCGKPAEDIADIVEHALHADIAVPRQRDNVVEACRVVDNDRQLAAQCWQ